MVIDAGCSNAYFAPASCTGANKTRRYGLSGKTKKIDVRVGLRTWEALSSTAALVGRTPTDLARFWIELGIASAAEMKPEKPAKFSSKTATGKTAGSGNRRRVRNAKKD